MRLIYENSYVLCRFMLHIFIIIGVRTGTVNSNINQTILFSLVTILIILDLIRFGVNVRRKVRLFLLSIIFIISLSISFATPAGLVYFFLHPWEIYSDKLIKDNYKVYSFIIGIMLYLSHFHHNVNLSRGFNLDNISGSFISFFFYPFFLYIAMVLIARYATYQEMKRLEFQELSQELEKANQKLKAYSKEIETLTIARERNRLAQEIHDSLGHSMAGLIMHLDFVEKVMESDQKKVKELIIKSQKMARQGMKEVREAVKTLKENEFVGGFEKRIGTLIDNLSIENKLDISISISPQTEMLSPTLKSLIYKNIREALTNVIKHSGADKVKIEISLDKNLELRIEDNGSGCKELSKGNGISGIQKRIKPYHGQLIINSSDGFTLICKIPLEEAEDGYNQSSSS